MHTRRQIALARYPTCGAAAFSLTSQKRQVAHADTATPPMSMEELTRRLMAVNTAAVADANKEGLRVMDERLRPIAKGQRFAGPARTVKCFNDFLTVIKGLDESVAGEVLVIDTQNSTRTVAGELFGTESMRRGLAAIVLDGPCRDTAQLAEMAIPVWITGVRPISGTANKIYSTQVPVTCGGVVVCPGDIVFGDDDGIIVASKAEMEALLPKAEAIVDAEDRLLKGMKAGISLLDQLNFKEHYEQVEAGNANSALQFRFKDETTEIA